MISIMSGQHKKRTYARNRTNLNRRGFEKNPEADSIFLLKLLLSVIAGSFWLMFSQPISFLGLSFGGFPIGTIVGILAVNRLEKRQTSRHIFYAVILIITILSYFVPAGIVL